MEIYKLTIKREIQLPLSKVILFMKQMSEKKKGDFQNSTGWILIRKVKKKIYSEERLEQLNLE